jgi:hypothetical protein
MSLINLDCGPINLGSSSFEFTTGSKQEKIHYVGDPPAVFLFTPLAYYHIKDEYQSEKDMARGITERQDDGWEKIKVDGMKIRFRKVSYYMKKRIG